MVSQYFRRRLNCVRGLCKCAQALGFVVTPAVLGSLIPRHGLLRSLLIQQAALLQLLVLVLPYRKPAYMRQLRRRYRPLDQLEQEEDDTVYPPPTEMSTVTTAPTKRALDLLRDSFADERDASTSQHTVEESTAPVPIRGELAAVADESRPPSKWSHLYSGAFYLETIVLLAKRCSSLVFWTLFPVHLYASTPHGLHARQAAELVGEVALGGLAAAAARFVLPARWTSAAAPAKHAIGAIAHLWLAAAPTEGWLLAGAVLHTVCERADGDPRIWRALAEPLAGVLLLILACTGPHTSVPACFWTASLLHGLAAALLLSQRLMAAVHRLCPIVIARPLRTT